jgi:hypothetical protein
MLNYTGGGSYNNCLFVGGYQSQGLGTYAAINVWYQGADENLFSGTVYGSDDALALTMLNSTCMIASDCAPNNVIFTNDGVNFVDEWNPQAPPYYTSQYPFVWASGCYVDPTSGTAYLAASSSAEGGGPGWNGWCYGGMATWTGAGTYAPTSWNPINLWAVDHNIVGGSDNLLSSNGYTGHPALYTYNSTGGLVDEIWHNSHIIGTVRCLIYDSASSTWYGTYYDQTSQSTSLIQLSSSAEPVHDVAISDVTSLKTVVFHGYTMNMNVTAADTGNFTETFNVTVYANMTYIASQNGTLYLPVTYVNTTAIATQTVTMNSGNSTTLTFTWNTAGFAKGYYTISAYAWPVLGETNTANNNFTDGLVYVSMIGDLTGTTPFVPDGKCDGRDITVVAKCFGSHLGDSRYNPNCDIFNRGRIDGRDITIVAEQFGKHSS